MNRKAITIIAIVFSLIGTSWLTRIIMRRVNYKNHSAYLTFEGYVLDQYGKPVPGANVTVAYPWPQDGSSQPHTEDDNTYTDEAGHYVYNSKPKRLLYAEVMASDSYDNDGNLL